MFLISRKAIRFILYIIIIDLHSTRAANNFSFLKGHMSDQVSMLVAQNRNVVGRFLFLIIIFKGKSFFKKNYFLSLLTYYLVKKFVRT